jgi:AcrR family transcriptional regulator
MRSALYWYSWQGLKATKMEEDSRRAHVLKTARASIHSNGTNFTIAAVCREAGLSRSQIRRIFSTKAKLLKALKQEIEEHPRTNNILCRIRDTDDESLECRLRVVERAIASLEVRLLSEQRDHLYAIGSPEEGHSGELFLSHTEARPSTSPIVDVQPFSATFNSAATLVPTVGPPPKIEACEREAHLNRTDIAGGSQKVPELPPILPLGLQEPSPQPVNSKPNDQTSFTKNAPPIISDSTALFEAAGNPIPTLTVEPEVMRTILKNARAQVGKVVDLESQNHVSRSITVKRFAKASSAVLVVLGFLVGALAHYRNREVKTEGAQSSSTVVPKVTIINATGEDGTSGETPPAWIKSAMKNASRGDAHAQTSLALAYLRGDGVGVNPAAAIGWSEMAALQGDPSAQFILATLYTSGIKPNPQLAVRWFSTAAVRGNIKAMHNLALAYLNGDGVPKNPAAAVGWFSKAASAGYRDSAFDLGVLYERGEEVQQDPSLAMRWYNIAASRGDLEAVKRIGYLKTSFATDASDRPN